MIWIDKDIPWAEIAFDDITQLCALYRSSEQGLRDQSDENASEGQTVRTARSRVMIPRLTMRKEPLSRPASSRETSMSVETSRVRRRLRCQCF